MKLTCPKCSDVINDGSIYNKGCGCIVQNIEGVIHMIKPCEPHISVTFGAETIYCPECEGKVL